MSCFAGSWAEGLGEEGDLRCVVVQLSPGAMLDRLDNACGLSTQRKEEIARAEGGRDVESEGGVVGVRSQEAMRTRPPPRVPKPPPARKAAPTKQSYAKAAASAPAAPVAAPAPPKAPASPPSKTAALRKSCIKQGTKATKVIVQFPPSAKQPSVHQLWVMLTAFKPIDIGVTLRGDFILTFSQVLDSNDHEVLVKKFKKVYSVDVQVLNRGTTSLLKFPLVPTHHPDSSAVTSEWLHKTITGHPKWQNVEFVQTPRFIVPTGKSISYTATVFAEVADDRSASTAKRLLQTDVLFHAVPRRCKPWSVSVAVKQCGICLRWGHSTHHCSSKSAWCLACAGNHESLTHAAAAKAEPRYDTIKCANCHGKHWATAHTCPVFLLYRVCFGCTAAPCGRVSLFIPVRSIALLAISLLFFYSSSLGASGRLFVPLVPWVFLIRWSSAMPS